jgi:hypothetical protein
MSAARPSFETLLQNLTPSIERARARLFEAKTRAEIFEVRECAASAYAAAERLENAVGPHGTVSDALYQLLAGASEIMRLADARLRAVASVAADEANRPGRRSL